MPVHCNSKGPWHVVIIYSGKCGAPLSSIVSNSIDCPSRINDNLIHKLATLRFETFETLES